MVSRALSGKVKRFQNVGRSLAVVQRHSVGISLCFSKDVTTFFVFEDCDDRLKGVSIIDFVLA